jgi:hypothetical protein
VLLVPIPVLQKESPRTGLLTTTAEFVFLRGSRESFGEWESPMGSVWESWRGECCRPGGGLTMMPLAGVCWGRPRPVPRPCPWPYQPCPCPGPPPPCPGPPPPCPSPPCPCPPNPCPIPCARPEPPLPPPVPELFNDVLLVRATPCWNLGDWMVLPLPLPLGLILGF